MDFNSRQSTCSLHSIANGRVSTVSVIAAGCRPVQNRLNDVGREHSHTSNQADTLGPNRPRMARRATTLGQTVVCVRIWRCPVVLCAGQEGLLSGRPDLRADHREGQCVGRTNLNFLRPEWLGVTPEQPFRTGSTAAICVHLRPRVLGEDLVVAHLGCSRWK